MALNGIRNRINKLSSHNGHNGHNGNGHTRLITGPDRGQALEVWKKIITWFSGDHSISPGAWEPACTLGPLLPEAARKPRNWQARFKVALAAAIEALLEDSGPAALKNRLAMNEALQVAADLIIDEPWPAIIESDTTCMDGVRIIRIIYPDDSKKCFVVKPGFDPVERRDYDPINRCFTDIAITAEDREILIKIV